MEAAHQGLKRSHSRFASHVPRERIMDKSARYLETTRRASGLDLTEQSFCVSDVYSFHGCDCAVPIKTRNAFDKDRGGGRPLGVEGGEPVVCETDVFRFYS
jgi:hypothetical protein